jgi:hypothetical protein
VDHTRDVELTGRQPIKEPGLFGLQRADDRVRVLEEQVAHARVADRRGIGDRQALVDRVRQVLDPLLVEEVD